MASDEKRFLFLVDERGNAVDSQTPDGPTNVNIVFNWFTELNENLPVGKE
ncbi:MAG: hypothetical protein O2960_09155 [Verrucomicrobia bacterium]|nr:hypothetical protein [Verrucomicrobiota bacterium]